MTSENITKKEIELFGKLVYYAANRMSNSICNDIDEEWLESWTKKELIQLDKECFQWNNSSDEHNQECDGLWQPDWVVIKYLFHKLINK